jgi:hypothetical protein
VVGENLENQVVWTDIGHLEEEEGLFKANAMKVGVHRLTCVAWMTVECNATWSWY